MPSGNSRRSDRRIPKDMSFVRNSPVRVHLVSIDIPLTSVPENAPRDLEFFLNPESLTLRTAADWSRIAIPGLSHEVLQFSHTKSYEVNFDLQWANNIAAERNFSGLGNNSREAQRDPLNRQFSRTLASLDNSAAYKDYLLSLTSPIDRGLAPSRVRLIWPEFLNIVGAVTDVSFTFSRFAQSGAPLDFTARLSLVEARLDFRNRAGTSFISNTEHSDALQEEVGANSNVGVRPETTERS